MNEEKEGRDWINDKHITDVTRVIRDEYMLRTLKSEMEEI